MRIAGENFVRISPLYITSRFLQKKNGYFHQKIMDQLNKKKLCVHKHLYAHTYITQ